MIRQRLHQITDDRLRVAKEHERLRRVIQLVFDAGEARVHRALDGIADTRFVRVDDRHTEDRAARIVPRSRVDHVVGPDDECDVRLRHVVVNVIHLDQLVVWDLRLRQQNVHVAGHAAGHGMNREAHIDAALG